MHIPKNLLNLQNLLIFNKLYIFYVSDFLLIISVLIDSHLYFSYKTQSEHFRIN